MLEEVWPFRETQELVSEVSKLKEHEATLEQLPEVGEGAILMVREFREENSSEELRHISKTLSPNELEELSEGVAREITTGNGNTNKLILDSVKKYRQNRCNELITNTGKGRAFWVAKQVLIIYMACNSISKASNILEENQNELPKIKGDIEKMEEKVVKFLASGRRT